MTSRPRTFYAAVGLAIVLCAAYSNHFDNPFEFDDAHTIVDNGTIRDIRNIPRFFTDSRYFGTRSDNTNYRPVVATLNAIDYHLAGGLKQQYFHAHIFLTYLVLLVLLAFMFKAVFRLTEPGLHPGLLAVLLAGFYGLHAANAETINYIIMRSDSFSTLCIVASFLLYQHPVTRKGYVYLVTMIIGILTKEPGAVFAPLLFFYILLFEEGVSLRELVTFKRGRETLGALRKAAPALIITVAMVVFIRHQFTSNTSILDGTFSDRWRYFYSQWVVIAHYLGNFILPLNLSADPDLATYPSPLNQHVLFSLILLLSLVAVAVVASTRRSGYPITFGILWYFIALAPTSSIVIIDQLANDHRTFLPNIGLVLALGWALHLMRRRWDGRIRGSAALRWSLVVMGVAVLLLHAYGTYQRSAVWGSSDRLWADAAKKSPNNGRALMNHGLTLMARGDYAGAESHFRRTLQLMPAWAYIHINMGILRNARGFPTEAEEYFRNAIRFQPTVPESYYYFARWLAAQDRMVEAMPMVEAGLQQSPSHVRLQALRVELMASVGLSASLELLRKRAVEARSADLYLELSLVYYRGGRFKECVWACEQALSLKPDYALAYNNLCSAYSSLGEWDRAIAACTRALALAPRFDLARNNLKWATDEKAKVGGARRR